MKRNLLMLCALICFLSPHAWADTTGTTTPAKGQPDAISPVQRNATGDNRAMEPSGNDASKSDAINRSEQAGNAAGKTKCCGWFNMLISILPASLFIVFLLVVKANLKGNKWSLGDALSESDLAKNPDGSVLKDKDGNPVFIRSSSRLIAFIGFFGIIVWIVGLSIPTLYQFACTGKVPDLSGISAFLLAQAGIFAPYVANKIAGAFKQ